MPPKSSRIVKAVPGGRRVRAPEQPAAGDNNIELGKLDDTLGFWLRTAQEVAFRAFMLRVGETGTPTFRYAILALIDANPGLTQVALSRTIRRDTSSMTPALDDLVERGLVSRIRQEHDRRSYALQLTPLGRKVMQQMRAGAETHERELEQLIGRENRAAFVEALKRITNGIEARLADGGGK